MVVGMSLYSQIREAYISGESQRSIAKRLGVSRPTVKKYCEGAIMPGVRKEYLRTPSVVTPQVENFIRMCLETDKEEGLRKQSHTAKRIYDRLVSEMGFTGSYSIVRRVVHEMKEQYIPAQADIPLEYDPGDAIQIDWGEATVYMNGEKLVINLFCARLCHSCAPYVIAYKRQNLESFLDAIIRTFQYYGGVPRRVIFDNARVAVKSGFGAHAAAQDDYNQLSAHYGFEPVFCNPASGNEKGLVENLVGYIRRNVCVPLPKVKNLEELNGKLLEKCVHYLDHKVDSRPAPVGVMLEQDRQCLQMLPHYTPDVSKRAYPTVSRYSTVLFETNSYSVPCRHTGKNATLKAYPNHIEIWIAGSLVARHERLFGRKGESLDLQHYLPILAQKGRAIRYARPVQNAVPAEFINWLEGQELTAKEMVELLGQCSEVGYAAIMCGRIPNSQEPVVEDPVRVPTVDLGAYDALCGKGAAAS